MKKRGPVLTQKQRNSPFGGRIISFKTEVFSSNKWPTVVNISEVTSQFEGKKKSLSAKGFPVMSQWMQLSQLGFPVMSQ